jgi:membrane fusion protein (multidrug efflux system)
MAIYAPFAGTVGLRQISPGAYVKAGNDIVRLDNLSTLKVDFKLPENYLARLAPNQEVFVRVDAFPDDSFHGKVYASEPGIDERTRTVVLRARINNPGDKLKPGMFVRVSLTVGSRPNAMTVPEQAIWPQGRDSFVYRVVDGKAALTKVQIGTRRPGIVEIASGLTPEDMVVTDGQIKLKDGAPVMVVPQNQPATAGSAPSKG